MSRVLKVQKPAIRCLENFNFQNRYRQTFKQLKLKTIIAIYIQELILHLDKLGLPIETHPHRYNTRSVFTIPLVRHRTVLHDKRASTRLYNKLPAPLGN